MSSFFLSVLLLGRDVDWAGYVGTTPQKQFDCLAGVCLNTKTDAPPPNEVVVVAGDSYERVVETCSGTVTAVSIQSYWLSPAMWANLGTHPRPGYFHLDSADAAESRTHILTLIAKQASLGWTLVDTASLPDNKGAVTLLLREDRWGARGAMYLVANDGTGVKLVLRTSHPDEAELCKTTLGL